MNEEEDGLVSTRDRPSSRSIRAAVMLAIGSLFGFTVSCYVFTSEVEATSLRSLVDTPTGQRLGHVISSSKMIETAPNTIFFRGAIEIVATPSKDQTVDRSRDSKTHQHICCLVYASHFNHIKLINTTWGKRCDVTHYINESTTIQDTIINDLCDSSQKANPSLPSTTGMQTTSKQPACNSSIYQSQGVTTDWILVADDNTYVIVDNLRHMLTSHSPNSLIYFAVQSAFHLSGRRRRDTYVLSRAAFHKMEKHRNTSLCHVSSAECLDSCGIRRGITLDSRGYERFHTVSSQRLVIPQWLVSSNTDRWRPYQYYPVKCGAGHSQCSDRSVIFAGIDPTLMEVIEYFIYRLKIACL